MGRVGEDMEGENTKKVVSKSFPLRCFQPVKGGYANYFTCQTSNKMLKYLFPYLPFSSHPKGVED